MFCDPENPEAFHCLERNHWCPLCKITGCEWCCGCPECHKSKRGGWSPEGIQVRHGGAWDRVLTRRAAPSSGGTLRTAGSMLSGDGTVPDPCPP